MLIGRGRSIAVAVGHSRGQSDTLESAISLGESLEAELLAIHVVDVKDYPIDPDAMDYEKVGRASYAVTADHVATRLKDYPYGWRWIVTKGSVHQKIVEVAKEQNCQLIIVGTDLQSSTKGTLQRVHTTMAGKVTALSAIPVLIVPRK